MKIDFMFYLLMRTVKIAMNMYTSQSHHMEQDILATIIIKNIRPEELTEINLLIRNSAKKKLPVTVILGDSIVKEVKGWELSDEKNKVVTKQFSGATTDDMKSYIQPTISNDPECIVLHCGTNNLKQNTSAVEMGRKF